MSSYPVPAGWEEDLFLLRSQLKKADKLSYFAKSEKKELKEKMKAAGMANDLLDTMPLAGRVRPLLALLLPEEPTIDCGFSMQETVPTIDAGVCSH